MRFIGGDDHSFFSTAILVAFLAAISVLAITKMGHSMRNATFQAPPAVQTATALPAR